MAQVQNEQTNTGGPSAGASAQGEGPARKIAGDAGETVGERGRSFAGAASDAGHGVARANAEVLRKSVETTGQAMHAGLQAADSTLQGFADTIGRAFGLGDPRANDLAEQSAANARTVSEATSALTQGMQAASREWIGIAQDGMKARLDAAQRLAGCRSAPDLIAVQSELWRESVQRGVEASQVIARTSLQAIDEAHSAIRAQPR